MSTEHPRNNTEKGYSKYLKIKLLMAFQYTKIRLVWAAQGLKPGLRKDRPAANRLNNYTAIAF